MWYVDNIRLLIRCWNMNAQHLSATMADLDLSFEVGFRGTAKV